MMCFPSVTPSLRDNYWYAIVGGVKPKSSFFYTVFEDGLSAERLSLENQELYRLSLSPRPLAWSTF